MSENDKERFDVSLEDLQTFVTVSDLGSFSRAAERLNLSQPSISNRVKRLEEKLGVQLLVRTTRKVGLTPHGKRLYERASVTLLALRDLLRDFYAETGARRREVDIAATMMIASVALAPIVASFCEAHPEVTVRLNDRLPESAVAAVVDGRSDMAVLTLERSDPALHFEPLVSDKCVAVVGLSNPLLRKRSVTLAELLAYPLLSPDGHLALREAVRSRAVPMGLDIMLADQARGVSNVMTLLAMAAAGLGVCIHPSSLIPAEFRPTIGLVEIEDCEIIRTYGIVTSADRKLSPAAALFRDHLRNEAKRAHSNWSSLRLT